MNCRSHLVPTFPSAQRTTLRRCRAAPAPSAPARWLRIRPAGSLLLRRLLPEPRRNRQETSSRCRCLRSGLGGLLGSQGTVSAARLQKLGGPEERVGTAFDATCTRVLLAVRLPVRRPANASTPFDGGDRTVDASGDRTAAAGPQRPTVLLRHPVRRAVVASGLLSRTGHTHRTVPPWSRTTSSLIDSSARMMSR